MAVEFRKMTAQDEEAVAELLRRAFGRDKADLKHWKWKFVKRPGFDHEQIMLTYEDGELVGCLHTLPTELSFADWAEVPSSVAGDLAVLPEKRDRGYPRPMFKVLQDNLEQEGRFITYGAAPDRLAIGYYHDKLDMGWSRGLIRGYSKPLGTRALARKVGEFSDLITANPDFKQRLQELDVSIQLNLGVFGICTVVASGGQLSLVDGPVDRPSIRLRCSLLLVQLLVGRRGSMGELFMSIVKRTPFALGSPRSYAKAFKLARLLLGVRGLRSDE